jgi:pimeloyl-ACP methyl ester carboxylesterase
MISLRTVGTEVSALGAVALSFPLRLVLRHERLEPTDADTAPVVFVHGFLGDPTNFLVLRIYLGLRGVRSFASFAYGPRFDYQRLARGLHRAVEQVCAVTGSPTVDVVGHSLGGLVGRYLVETDEAHRVRRLVTLGAPYFGSPMPPEEHAIFAAADPFIPPPHRDHGPHAGHLATGGRVAVIPHCGHWGLLYHPAVLREVERALRAPTEATRRPPAPLAIGTTAA